MPLRKVAAVVLVTAAATAGALVLGACDHTSHPTRGDLLPEASLTYPGAVETDESFVEGDDDRGVDGNDLSNPPRLERSLTYSSGTAAEVLAWYRQRLEERGWTYHAVGDPAEAVKLLRRTGDIDHIYEVIATRPGAVQVVYVMKRVG